MEVHLQDEISYLCNLGILGMCCSFEYGSNPIASGRAGQGCCNGT